MPVIPLLPLLAACGDPLGVEARILPDLATVVEVTWDAVGDDAGRVAYGVGGALDRTAPGVDDGGRVRALLLGIGPFEDVSFQVLASSVEEAYTSDVGTIRTGGLPAELPDGQLLADDGTWDDYLLVCAWSLSTWVLILDRDGTVVWHHRIPGDALAVTAAFAPEGGDLLYLEGAANKDALGSALVRVAPDGVETARVPLPGAHHVFAAAADGTIGFLAIDVRKTEAWGPVVGDAVQTWDPESGEVHTLTSTWDLYEPSLDGVVDSGFYPQGFDWSHGNGIARAEDRDTWWVTLGGLDRAIEVDGASGALSRVLGQEDGYTPGSAEAVFGGGFGPHGPTWTPDGTLLLFDNAPLGEDDGGSRVIELALDDGARRADLAWAYVPDERLDVRTFGATGRRADGTTVAGFGSAGEVHLVDPAGALRWAVQVGAGVGGAVPVTDLYAGR